MPPHCDSLDGPVVVAARKALEEGRVEFVLPFVPADGEAEVTEVFEQTMAIRGASPAVGAVADRWFFENVVRVHRAGEGAPYTGLKPAGLSEGPVIPVAERALETSRALIIPAFRGPGLPFGPEQTCDEGAGPADQLTAFLGRVV